MAPPADREGSELVPLIAARDAIEAGMIRGLLEERGIPCLARGVGVDGPRLGVGLLPSDGGPQQLLVHAARFEEASAVLAETLVEDPVPGEDAWEETANAAHLEDAGGGREPRGYGLVGAYARIYLFSFAVIAAAFGVFLLLRLT